MNLTGVVCPNCGVKTDQSPCWKCDYDFDQEERNLKYDITRLTNLLNKYRNHIITQISLKQNWRVVPDIINSVDIAINTLKEGL